MTTAITAVVGALLLLVNGGSGVCFIYDLPVQTTADLRTAEYGSEVIVGLGCHSGSWKVDSTGYAS